MSQKSWVKQPKDQIPQTYSGGQGSGLSSAILPSSACVADKEPAHKSPSPPLAGTGELPPSTAPASPAALNKDQAAMTKPIIDAIEGCKVSKGTLVRHDLDQIRERLTESEDHIGTVEDTRGSHIAQCPDLQSQVSSLVSKVEDAENRQRLNNVRVLGLSEGAERSHPAVFA